MFNQCTPEVTDASCRCGAFEPDREEGARGRSSRGGWRYMQALYTLWDVLCIVQHVFRNSHSLLPSVTGEQATLVARLVKELHLQASQVQRCPFIRTKCLWLFMNTLFGVIA